MQLPTALALAVVLCAAGGCSVTGTSGGAAGGGSRNVDNGGSDAGVVDNTSTFSAAPGTGGLALSIASNANVGAALGVGPLSVRAGGFAQGRGQLPVSLQRGLQLQLAAGTTAAAVTPVGTLGTTLGTAAGAAGSAGPAGPALNTLRNLLPGVR